MSRGWRWWSGYGLAAIDRICSWGVEYWCRLLRDCCWAPAGPPVGVMRKMFSLAPQPAVQKTDFEDTAVATLNHKVDAAAQAGRPRRRTRRRPATQPAAAPATPRSAAGCCRGRRLAPGNRCRPQVAACRTEGPLAPAHGRGGRSACRRAAAAASARTDDRAASAAMSAKHGHFDQRLGPTGDHLQRRSSRQPLQRPGGHERSRRRIPDEPVLDDPGAAGQYRRQRF